ncbi:MAG: ThuA domain-containing protein [Rhodothermales bacterium]
MKSTLRIPFVLLLAVILYGCSGAKNTATMTVMDKPGAIRVLMITATHGYRHESIEAARQVMQAASDTTEFLFDMTENLEDLNDANLAKYDVLFFANSTLRTANDLTDEERMAAADPMVGNWGNYDISYEGRRGVTKGKIALSGTASSLTGNMQMEGQPTPSALSAVKLTGNQLTLVWSAGNAGDVTAVASIDGDALTGVVKMGTNEMPLTGTRTGPAERLDDGPRVTHAQRQAIMRFVRAGKGVAVAHAGLDALYDWKEYETMVGGGLFKAHPWTQDVRIVVEEPTNPAMSHLGNAFELKDEIYVLNENPRWNSRVLASLDMASVGVTEEPADQERNDYPISWIRKYEGGKVFVTKLGHFAEVWQNPAFIRHVLQGMRMVAGRVDADFGGHRVKEVIAADVWPDDIAVDERGNVWIAELRGKIHRYDAQTKQTRLLATIKTTEPTGIEHGIYGIEVDPNFYNGEPYVYIFYAEPETFINTLYRYEYRNDNIDFSTEKVILRVPTEPQCCHQAGDLEWGADGTLFISTGDTGYSGTKPEWEISEDRIKAFAQKYDLKEDIHWSRIVDSERTSQNLTDLRGKVLRINKDGSIPKDNPFYGQPGVRWEIFAYGLRNPYRIKWDDQTQSVWIGVVGPDAVYDYDEYNVAKGGENFGWPRSIGRLFYNEWTPDKIPNFHPPIWEYRYDQGGARSATFGPIYRYKGPGAFPAIFQNKALVYDWSRRWIKWADIVEGTYTTDDERMTKNNPLNYSTTTTRLKNVKIFDQLTTSTPISMELGPDGCIYVAEYDGFWDPGPNAQVTRYCWVND